MKRRGVTVVVHVDGDLASRQYRLPLWVFEAGKWGGIVVGVLIVLFFTFAGPITTNAGKVPGMRREIARLEQENTRVQQLAAALNRAEASYQELRAILGARAPQRSRSATGPAGVPDPMRASPVRAAAPGVHRYPEGASVPAFWPLDVRGFVTRGQTRSGATAETHPGVDVAVPQGTPIRASGGGTVEAAGADPDYGLFVLLRHPDGFQTMYGHASRLVVREGDAVAAGQVIALSGNTGRSTAPHLHFEVRRDGRPLDPMTVVQEAK
jgi:murein DD-endopeptidase MepM/ murein hydrolase activator NlpD